jgi:hypothetical protein
MKQRSRNWPVKVAIAAMILLLVIPAVVLLNLQNIIDKFTVLNFEPTAAVEQLSERSQFTDRGEFLFFASQPVLDGTQTFNDICRQNKEYKISILGCYADKKIYIYDIDDERLDGVREVTAAHEMLHAAYDRLSTGDRDRIGRLLKVEYDKHSSDELVERIKYYEENQPGQFYNELHSIIGTEFAEISDDLEEYYSTYFADRTTIVALYQQYRGTLKGFQNTLDRLSAEMTAQRELVTEFTKEYSSDVNSLNNDIELFNSRAQSGYYSSQSQFHRDRQSLVSRSSALSVKQRQITVLIGEYNEKVKEYSAYSVIVNDLHESIDSTIAPPPSL